MSRNFMDLLRARWAAGRMVCVGLDSQIDKIPRCIRAQNARELLIAFNRAIIEATYDLVCVFRFNTAFYEALGSEGWAALEETVRFIHEVDPAVPVILDAMRGDSNEAYARMLDTLEADAITVHPFLGQGALQSFLDCADKGVFVLCKTSNPGSSEYQNLPIDPVFVASRTDFPRTHEGECDFRLYELIAHRVATRWNGNGNCGLVVGANYPEELKRVRELAPAVPFLVPGVGFQTKGQDQGKVVRQVVENGRDGQGQGLIINAARSIIFASPDDDFAEAARAKTIELHSQIQHALGEV